MLELHINHERLTECSLVNYRALTIIFITKSTKPNQLIDYPCYFYIEIIEYFIV